jgi:type IV pilus assembly protein PilO
MAPKPQPAAGGSALDRLSPVAKFGLGFLFFFLVGVVYFVIFHGDLETEIESAQNAQHGLEAQLDKAETSKAEYQKDLDEKTRREQLALEQKKILPDDPETPAFLAALQGVATLSGVNLTSWSPIEEQPQEFYAKVPMKLTLVGKFHQVAKFFHGVGQLDRIINVEDIRIKTPKVNGDEVQVEVECLATAFRSSRPGEQAAKRRPGAAPAPAGGGH